jgi:3-hydroxyisobutyrate dehydrogenase-like beta-hydroxyacid dehydrogenase
MQTITVLGLGSMGSAIAGLFIDHSHQVTIWNRTANKAAPFAKKGASIAATPAEGIAASELVVMCVYDYAAANAILNADGVAKALSGKILVQLTTGSPEEARKALAWTEENNVKFLAGAIQAAPSQMGRPDTPLLLSGNAAIYRSIEPVLKQLAGNIAFLGDQIDAAATMDLATLSYVYGATAGFLHGALIAETQGLNVGVFGKLVADISPSFGAFFAHEGGVIESGDFAVTESPLRISIEAIRRILQGSIDTGINTEIPAFLDGLFRRAEKAGLGDQELAALIKVLREKNPVT